MILERNRCSGLSSFSGAVKEDNVVGRKNRQQNISFFKQMKAIFQIDGITEPRNYYTEYTHKQKKRRH